MAVGCWKSSEPRHPLHQPAAPEIVVHASLPMDTSFLVNPDLFGMKVVKLAESS